jgi:hypothetical protein
MSRRLRRVNNPNTPAKIAEPTIDQKTGKVSPPTVTGSGSGSPSWRLIHIPRKAPIKPTTMETKQPPRSYPARDWPNAPATAAITSKIINPNKVISASSLILLKIWRGGEVPRLFRYFQNLNPSPAPEDQGKYKKNQEYDEKNFRNPCCGSGDATKP